MNMNRRWGTRRVSRPKGPRTPPPSISFSPDPPIRRNSDISTLDLDWDRHDALPDVDPAAELEFVRSEPADAGGVAARFARLFPRGVRSAARVAWGACPLPEHGGAVDAAGVGAASRRPRSPCPRTTGARLDLAHGTWPRARPAEAALTRVHVVAKHRAATPPRSADVFLAGPGRTSAEAMPQTPPSPSPASKTPALPAPSVPGSPTRAFTPARCLFPAPPAEAQPRRSLLSKLRRKT